MFISAVRKYTRAQMCIRDRSMGSTRRIALALSTPMSMERNKAEKLPALSSCCLLYTSYKFEQAKREYIVEPVFKESGSNTLFSLLLNLMRLDAIG